MLDEAHVIANPKAKQSRAVMLLRASRRWAVTFELADLRRV